MKKSISDIENEAEEANKERKDKGAFYTPAFITEFMVQDAIDGWINSKSDKIKHPINSKKYWLEYAEILKQLKSLTLRAVRELF